MSSVIAYSQAVEALITKEAWDETYFSLESLKAHLQSLPGWQRFDLWAQDTDDGNVRVLVVTNWDHPEFLALWVDRGVTVDAILRAMEPPPKSLKINLYEEIA
jgi:heme-degrading monooxygenase HmoA